MYVIDQDLQISITQIPREDILVGIGIFLVFRGVNNVNQNTN